MASVFSDLCSSVLICGPLLIYLAFMYFSNQARSHSIFALRFDAFVSPCGSPVYTTRSVGTFTYSLSARYSIRLWPGGQRSSPPPTWMSVGVVTLPSWYVGEVLR